MGDFLLDLRRSEDRALAKTSEFLRFYKDMRVERFDFPQFSLLLSSADGPEIWAPFVSSDQSLLIALCGRVALDQREWDAAAEIAGRGGLACKFLSKLYSEL